LEEQILVNGVKAFRLSTEERELLLSLRAGCIQILIYDVGRYPSAVSFILKDNKTVTIEAREESIAPRFEVFPISVSERVISSAPKRITECRPQKEQLEISILRKSEWSAPSNEDEKLQMIGESHNSTTQYEGKLGVVPSNAVNQATLDAGVEIKGEDGWSFYVATSMFPYALYVSDCDFSEPADLSIYDRIELSP
jgi:hypothetical protein